MPAFAAIAAISATTAFFAPFPDGTNGQCNAKIQQTNDDYITHYFTPCNVFEGV